MPRPCKKRHLGRRHAQNIFKPRGLPASELQEVCLSVAELEALRLKNLKNLDQTEAAKEMRISQSTFQRMLSSAYQKISDALVNGKALRIINKE